MVDRRSWLRAGALSIVALWTCLPAFPATAQGISLPDGAEAAARLPPGDVMAKAQALLEVGRGDEAAFWFYAGQLRYRSYLAAHRDLDPTGHPALFAALIETIGRPVNEYAFGDVTKLASTISMVLEWDRRYLDPSLAGAGHEKTRNGLEGLREQIMAQADSIRRERQQRGLPNR
ncbi:hypothetical protein ASF22_15925 [Methylobacterium sp. Leaf87]|uniref:hypothetical protein n=1 Tax=Methylobacterium sp. Leaf87 TaxID=1736243 RepID=UPI0006F8EA04|nr:hypothetical protein [Methylobacterium sp. Leaf87]KQO70762.1 hypothetical protein ASF22_15925 [Methylobacterium sp. Leaf87]